MKNRLFLFLALLWCQLASAADIVVTGPTKPIKPGAYVMLTVDGLDDDELAQASVLTNPLEGVTLLPAKTWGGKPIVFFSAESPGKYAVSVRVGPVDENKFNKTLNAGLAEAREAQIDADSLSELSVVVEKIGAKYPAGKSGFCVVEVSGVVVPPDPPIPVTTGIVWTIIIRTTDTMTADQAKVLSDLRQWTDQQPAEKVSHLEFPPDAVGPNGEKDARVAGWVAKIPASNKQPYAFVSQANATGKAAVVWQGELPAKADDLIAKIKELIR